MLFEALFGNPTIEKILFFLLINEKCYATQISRTLETPLTPIQQALNRLENGGILISSLEGKTRLFRFNPHYSFMKSLQTLLKEGYRQLPLKAQQLYFHKNDDRERTRVRRSTDTPSSLSTSKAISQLWIRLRKVQHLSFSAHSQMQTPSGWNGTGKADVNTELLAPDCLLFQETGVWTSDQGHQYDFKNSYRWRKDQNKGVISLEHLRQGRDNPVFLFELTPVSPSSFETVHPFLCKQDTYLAALNCIPSAIDFHWRILGPKKNEEIHYLYTEF